MSADSYIVALIEESTTPGGRPRFYGAAVFSEEKPTVQRHSRFVLATIHHATGRTYEEARAEAVAWARTYFPWLPLDNSR